MGLRVQFGTFKIIEYVHSNRSIRHLYGIAFYSVNDTYVMRDA